GFQQGGPCLGHRVDARPLPCGQPADHGELDLRVRPLGAAEVALLPPGEDRPDQVEVLGHAPSISAQPVRRTASRIAAAVAVAAAAPIWNGANGSGSSRPEARQKTTSPSTGVNTGSTALPRPAVAARATIEQPRLSSVASVQTHTGVEFPSGTRNWGGSVIA